MPLTLSYDAHSEIGLVRTNNQDSAYVSPTMLMVADGMGGAAAGDLASAIATWELERTDTDLDARVAAARAEREASDEPAFSGPDDPGDVVDVLTVLAGTLSRANDQLIERVEDDPALAGMGTTVCGFVLSGHRLAVVNIGDSRAYLVRSGRLHRVTRDHSWVQTLVDEGKISEDEALEHPHKNLVLKVLNGSTQHEPDLGWLDIQAGDRLMICSDGLCGLVTDAAMAPVLAAGNARTHTIDALVDLAHAAGGYDNITIVLADVETDGPLGTPEALGAADNLGGPDDVEHTLSFELTDADPEGIHERPMTEEERYALSGRRKPSAWLKIGLGVLIPVLALVGGGTAWYQYTQTQLFIGPAQEYVGLYRGVPDRVLGQNLATLLQRDPQTRVADLPPYYAERVKSTIPVADSAAASSTMAELREKAARCVAQREERARATTTPTPTPTTEPGVPAPEPAASGSATPGVSVTATPSPSATSITPPEDC